MAEIETWKAYGEWFPTAHLRLDRNDRIEQKWRRNFELCHPGGVVMGGNGHEEEWRYLPHVLGAGQG